MGEDRFEDLYVAGANFYDAGAEDLYVAGAAHRGGVAWGSSSGSPGSVPLPGTVRSHARTAGGSLRRKLSMTLALLLLLGGGSAVATFASLTATDTNSANNWQIAAVYFTDSAGNNVTAESANYTTGTAIASGAPNIATGSTTTLTYYIKVQFNNTDGNNATGVTLTPTYSAGSGSPTEADMDLYVQAGTGCTNLTTTTTSTTDSAPSTVCTGTAWSAFASGNNVIGTTATSTTFTTASGAAANCDGSSGSATWVSGGTPVTFQIQVTPNGSETAGTYGLSFVWTATSS